MDQPVICCVATVIDRGVTAARGARAAFLRGIEGGVHILDELSVNHTMQNGLETVNYVAQMNVYLNVTIKNSALTCR